MKITRIEYQKKDSTRVNLYSDDGFQFGIHVGLILKWQLSVGVELDENQVEQLKLEDIRYRLRHRATEYLNRGLKSSFQVRSNLLKFLKGKEGDWQLGKEGKSILLGMVEDTLESLTDLAVIDDKAFTEAYIRTVLGRGSYSELELKAKLYRYGIASDIVEEIISGLSLDPVALAKGALQKRFGSSQISKIDKKKISFLQRKGYNWDVISTLINDDIREREELVISGG